MKTIHKYELCDDHTFKLMTPQIFKPLHVGIQDGKYYLWAEVDAFGKTLWECVKKHLDIHWIRVLVSSNYITVPDDFQLDPYNPHWPF